MKKTKASDARDSMADDLRPEYRFDYTQARPNRFAGLINQERVVVTLDPDVSKVFTTPESVNEVLRAVIAVMPRKPRFRVRVVEVNGSTIDLAFRVRGGAVFCRDGPAPWPAASAGDEDEAPGLAGGHRGRGRVPASACSLTIRWFGHASKSDQDKRMRGRGKFQQYLHERGPFTDRIARPSARRESRVGRPGDRYPKRLGGRRVARRSGRGTRQRRGR